MYLKHLPLLLMAAATLVSCGRSEPQKPTATNVNPDDAAMRQFLDRDQKHVRTLAEIKAQQSASAAQHGASMPQQSGGDHAKN